jgi:hypothetical protein
VTRIYYETKYHRNTDIWNGDTMPNLISIALVAEDGREYYAVSQEIDEREDGERQRQLNDDITSNELLMTTVIPQLPLAAPPELKGYRWRWSLDWSSALVKPLRLIGNEVRDFIVAQPDPELWGWYATYKHVALLRLWQELPEGVPSWTNDLKQECVRLGNPRLPSMPGVTALGDAREVRTRHEWLIAQAGDSRG